MTTDKPVSDRPTVSELRKMAQAEVAYLNTANLNTAGVRCLKAISAALDAFADRLEEAERHAGIAPKDVVLSHSHMGRDAWIEGAGHRVYRQSDGEACFLCLVLERAEKAEREVERLEKHISGEAQQLCNEITALEHEVERLKEALGFAVGAIADAIGLEDGLDAAVGEALLKKIEAVHPEPIARLHAALRRGDRE